MYHKILPSGLLIQNTRPEHAERLEALQRRVFPDLSADEVLRAPHYLKHIELFPEGQFVVLDGEKVIGMSTTIRYHFATEDHSFLEISDNLWMTTHEPDGEWLYGMDVGVDSDYRGQGLAREIYRARQETVRELGLKGQITVGMINGYGAVSGQMSTDEYFEKLKRGELRDPTVSVQQRMGFEIIKLIHNYLDDPTCGNCGVLMVLPVSQEV